MLRAMKRIVPGLMALLFGWLAVVMLSPIVLALIRHDPPSGNPAGAVGIGVVGLACVAAAAWCLRRVTTATSTPLDGD